MYTIEEFDKAKTKVLKFILYKKRSENEIRRKYREEIEENLLDDIIEYLKEAEYIDDKKYIDKTVNNLISLKNLSIREVEHKLYSKGIRKEDIEDYIYENQEKLNVYEIKFARNIVSKKIGVLQQEEIKQYLLKKGYKIENINIALEDMY